MENLISFCNKKAAEESGDEHIDVDNFFKSKILDVQDEI
jgi:predicted nucleic-acid-binding Zn-ribbon protein